MNFGFSVGLRQLCSHTNSKILTLQTIFLLLGVREWVGSFRPGRWTCFFKRWRIIPWSSRARYIELIASSSMWLNFTKKKKLQSLEAKLIAYFSWLFHKLGMHVVFPYSCIQFRFFKKLQKPEWLSAMALYITDRRPSTQLCLFSKEKIKYKLYGRAGSFASGDCRSF